MKDELLCPICKTKMLWYLNSLFCPRCQKLEIFDANPNTMCPDFEKKYKRKEK